MDGLLIFLLIGFLTIWLVIKRKQNKKTKVNIPAKIHISTEIDKNTIDMILDLAKIADEIEKENQLPKIDEKLIEELVDNTFKNIVSNDTNIIDSTLALKKLGYKDIKIKNAINTIKLNIKENTLTTNYIIKEALILLNT